MWRFAIIILLIIPSFANASNAGIVRGLWYDQETFFAGETVRVYVAVRNNTGADLSGTVEFFVNGNKIERNNIAALDGRIIESWADWTPDYGTSSISATLSRTELSSTASGTKAVEVVSALAEDVVFIDYDTDKDGLGNLVDKDDGDGITDQDEKNAGTDPLVYNKQNSEVNSSETSGSTTTAINRSSEGNTYDNHTGASEGLEQFLTPSRADTVLGNVTETIHATKQKLDDYIKTRQQQSNKQTVKNIKVNQDGFGEIERVSSEERKDVESKPTAEKPSGFFGDILTIFGKIFSSIFTVVLAALSFVLGYPALIQLFLLFLILYVMYRLAKKAGSRPS